MDHGSWIEAIDALDALAGPTFPFAAADLRVRMIGRERGTVSRTRDRFASTVVFVPGSLAGGLVSFLAACQNRIRSDLATVLYENRFTKIIFFR